MQHTTSPTTPATSPSSTKWKRGRSVAPRHGYTPPATNYSTSRPVPFTPPVEGAASVGDGQLPRACVTARVSSYNDNDTAASLRDGVQRLSLPDSTQAHRPTASHFTSAERGVRNLHQNHISSNRNSDGYTADMESQSAETMQHSEHHDSGYAPSPTVSDDCSSVDNDERTLPTDSEYIPSHKGEESAEESSEEYDEDEEDEIEDHVSLSYQIPEHSLRAAMSASPRTRASYWSTKLYLGPEGQAISTHYCQTLEIAERVARHFVNEKILGFDIEWNPRSYSMSIKQNVSLIQLACENRIALFHVSLFDGTKAIQLMPPTLRTILESPHIYKVGVAIKGDFSRITKYFGIQAQGVLELSRLHNLVQWYDTDPRKVTKKLVNLAAQVQQHLQLPLYKGEQLLDDPESTSNVRESDWSKPLNIQQIHYAAADAYAGFRLYHVLEWKRKQLRPTPASPALCDNDAKPAVKPKVTRATSAKSKEASAIIVAQPDDAIDGVKQERGNSEEDEDEEAYKTAPEDNIDGHEPENLEFSSQNTGTLKQVGRVSLFLQGPDPGYPELPVELTSSDEYSDSFCGLNGLLDSHRTLSETDNSKKRQSMLNTDMDSDEFADPELEKVLETMDLNDNGTLQERKDASSSTSIGSQDPAITFAPTIGPVSAPDKNPRTVEYDLATRWAQTYLQSTIPSPDSKKPSRIRATVAPLRAYHMWHVQRLSIDDIAKLAGDPPLMHETVMVYILKAISLEALEYDQDSVRELIMAMPPAVRKRRLKWLTG